jgi:glutamate dehydrogenase (NAD(P)+)
VKTIAVGDRDGAIRNDKGIDLAALKEYVATRERKSVAGFPGAEAISPDDLLTTPCTVLVPAALERVITKDNATKLKCRILAEGANGPTTPEADAIIAESDIFVIPDVLCNAGGVTVSYFEWLKNLSHHRFGRLENRFQHNAFEGILNKVQEMTGKTISDRERNFLTRGGTEVELVNSGLEDTMITAYQQIRDTFQQHPDIADVRTAAFVCSLKKIASDYISMGIFP